MTLDKAFSRPTSVVVYGTSRPLLNWVAYAWACAADREVIWVDVRLRGEVRDNSDPVSRQLVPPDRLHVVYPDELVPDDAAARTAIGGVIRDKESSGAVRRLMDFLGLPSLTQQVLSREPSGGLPRILVFSNAHRVVSTYPPESVTQVVRAVVDCGTTLLSSFADAPSDARHAFETVLHLEGSDLREWKHAILRVERGPPDAPFRSGSEYRLSEIGPVAAVLGRELK